MNYTHLNKYLQGYIRSQKTIDAHLYQIQRFISLHPQYIDYQFEDLTLFFSQNNEKYRQEDGKVSGSVANTFSALKWLYSYLLYTGIRDEHPFPPSYSIKGTRKRGLDTKKLFSPQELQGVLRYAEEKPIQHHTPRLLRLRNLVTLSLLIHQGITVHELIQLKVSDIDLSAGTIRIRQNKQANARTLPLLPSQILLLNEYLTGNRTRLLRGALHCPYLIISLRCMQESADGIRSILERYEAVYPEKSLTPTNIRKSVIYNKLNVEKRPIEEVQVFAGHKWPSSTEKYLSAIDFNNMDFINEVHPMELL